MEENQIINKVANSSLISIDIENFVHKGDRVIYDIKQNLFQDLILREKDFREFISNYDWSQYQGKNVAITCTSDAIVPTWAYMLLGSKIEPYANYVMYGNLDDLEKNLLIYELGKIDPEKFKDAKVVVKGCSELKIPELALVELTRLLVPHVSSLMFGEPCSTVPIYKRPKN
jgi:hypothetical protein